MGFLICLSAAAPGAETSTSQSGGGGEGSAEAGPVGVALEVQEAARAFRKQVPETLGLDARTVIDVGVDRGTKPLYDAFDHCFFVLVDPRRGAESRLRHQPARYVFVNKGLASAAGRCILQEQDAGKTTFLERTILAASPTLARYEVETTTLDGLLDAIGCEAPIGIKIDTEGYELEVVKGLTKYWDRWRS